MNVIYHPVSQTHNTGLHPEHPDRIQVLANHFQLSETTPLPAESYLSLVHSPEYIDFIRQCCLRQQPIDGDTVTSAGSWEAALGGVGLALRAAEQQDFALIRPPGHHAHASRTGGFCLFNNIAIAAQRLVREAGQRVAIIDIDGHCGDGTQTIFWESDQVLFISLHQYPAFPQTGFIHEIGAGAGRGYTINIPLPPGAADDIFLNAIDHILSILHEFNPDILGISAGFDAHWSDPLLQLQFSNQGFYEAGHRLGAEFPRRFAVLEGGYNRETLPGAVEHFLAGINGAKAPTSGSSTISGLRVWETYEAHLYGALGKLREFWTMV